jgi:nifR3 family TIM-barrel protein
MSSPVSLPFSTWKAGNSPLSAIPVYLAPMSGLTDTPFRRLARRYGATMVVSEMVASERFAAGHAEEIRKGAEDTAGSPYIIQLAGCDAAWMREAAIVAEANGAAAIDINMGCPAKRVVGGYGGSALMRDLDHAAALIAAVRSSVAVPVSVKMRLGWDHDCRNAPELARRAEELGVYMVSVHGRTRNQFYTGSADWHFVRRMSEEIGIPLLINGDIIDLASARAALQASCATGVMVGRAAIGRPWLLGQIAAGLNGTAFVAPSVDEVSDIVLEHLSLSIDLYGERRGLLNFRKHLAAYLRHTGVSPIATSALCRIETGRDLERAVVECLHDGRLEAA